MRRRIRQWWRAAVAAVAILSPHAAIADQPVRDIQVAATQYAFEPAGTNWHLGFNISRKFF
jgi:hypothetical protein